MMNVVIRRQRKRFIHLLEHSGRHFAWVLGLLTVSLLGHWPSQDILVGGAALGLWLLLLSLWVFRSRLDLAWLIALLAFQAVCLPVVRTLAIEASWWHIPQMLLSMMAVFYALLLLVRSRLQNLAKVANDRRTK